MKSQVPALAITSLSVFTEGNVCLNPPSEGRSPLQQIEGFVLARISTVSSKIGCPSNALTLSSSFLRY